MKNTETSILSEIRIVLITILIFAPPIVWAVITIIAHLP